MNRFALKNGLAQSDLDFANFKPTNADLSLYAGANMTWNTSTKKFDAASGGGGGSGIPGVFKNVMTAPYNATGNGTTDDTLAIQSAINDVFTAGGGTVFFPRPSAFYLCNGAFDATTNSILKIPLAAALTDAPRVVRLQGEVSPMWGTYSADGFAVKLKTTRNDGTGTCPSFLAGGAASYFGSDMDPRNMNQVRLEIKNLRFDVTGDTMFGLRLDSTGMAILEDVAVLGPALGNAHGTVGIAMPRFVNMSQSQASRILSFGFDKGMVAGELFVLQWAYLSNCNVGILFNGGNGPCFRAHVVCDTCSTGVRFANVPPLYAGSATVDMIYFHEHNPSAPTVYDIDDASNAGGGIIKWAVSQASTSGINAIPLVVNGGANLQLLRFDRGNDPVFNSLKAATVNATSVFQVNGTPLAASHLSNGVSGTGGVALTAGPSLTAPRVISETVATLPGSPAPGQLSCVTDGAASLAWGATLAGGGSTKYLVWWNGVNWTVAGK
jgi:hypothetical protein